jgi:hypothetical protein
MSKVYKIIFTKSVSIDVIHNYLEKINDYLVDFGLGIMDFNIENYQVDQVLREAGEPENMMVTKKGEKLNYMYGYMKFLKDGQYGDFFKTFKKEVINLMKDENPILKVMIQEPDGMILDKNFVEIP